VGGPGAARAAPPDEPAFGWIEYLAVANPGDPGAVAPALLNYLLLEAGQALIVAPGEIHAYLRGTGVEIMGGSDNVIRGGLTPKHVSVRDLRDILDLESRVPTVVEPVVRGAEECWPAPFEEFELSRVTLHGHEIVLPRRGPEVDLCIAGAISIADGGDGGDGADGVRLKAGESCFATATGGALRANGTGVLVRATPRRADQPSVDGVSS
jgi:mannose-6-phosphate isomerase